MRIQGHLQLFELRESDAAENRQLLTRQLMAQAPDERVTAALWQILRGDAEVVLSLNPRDASRTTPAKWFVRAPASQHRVDLSLERMQRARLASPSNPRAWTECHPEASAILEAVHCGTATVDGAWKVLVPVPGWRAVSGAGGCKSGCGVSAGGCTTIGRRLAAGKAPQIPGRGELGRGEIWNGKVWDNKSVPNYVCMPLCM